MKCVKYKFGLFVQREAHMNCSPDTLAPDQAKQATLCVSYLLCEYVRTHTHTQLIRFTKRESISSFYLLTLVMLLKTQFFKVGVSFQLKEMLTMCLCMCLCVCMCVIYSITDTFEAFTLSFLSSLMISGPNSPFYKMLVEPKIGTDFSSVVGYSISISCFDL